MEFSKSDLERFKETYFSEYGKKLSNQEAFEMATGLTNLLKIIIQGNEYEKEQWLQNKV